MVEHGSDPKHTANTTNSKQTPPEGKTGKFYKSII